MRCDISTHTPLGNRWAALLVLCLGNFLILLDTTVVNAAAPDMMSSLDAGIDEILWVLNGYLLALASLLIVFGRLGDMVGPRGVFIAGLSLFAIASVLCGVAQTPDQLIAARVIQGVGAAALLPQALVLIAGIFPPERRGAAFGIFTAVGGIAAVSGVTLGGLVITEWGWQWIFYVNAPLGLLGVILTIRHVPDIRSRRPHRFDLIGVGLATLGLIGIVYALVEGERHQWGTIAGPVSIPLVLLGAVALLVAFVAWERRQAEPLIPLTLFHNRNFTIATVLTLITSFALYGFLLVFVIETQTLLGMSPLQSGLAALPMTLTLSAVAPIAGRLTDRIDGRRLLIAGLVAYALGVAGVAYIPTPASTAVTFILPLMLVGVGIGSAIAPTTTEAMREITPQQAGAASGVLNTARQAGAGLGAAVVGAVLQNRLVAALHDGARERAEQLPADLRQQFIDGFDEAASRGVELGSGQHGGIAAPPHLPVALADRFNQLAAETLGSAFVPAARPTLTVVAVVLLIGATLAGFMRRRPATTTQRAGRVSISGDGSGSPDY